MKRIVILASGSGSLAQSIFDADFSSEGAEVVALICDKPGAHVLQRAEMRHIESYLIPMLADRSVWNTELEGLIAALRPDLVVSAGFMRILTDGFVAHYQGRLINIHPSLLPAFTGLNTHARAIEAGCKFAGATVHRVTAELDHGPILAQAVVPVLPDDTADTLAARVLTQEHLIYPKAVAELLT